MTIQCNQQLKREQNFARGPHPCTNQRIWIFCWIFLYCSSTVLS